MADMERLVVPPPSSETVFLVSGGAKGITAACVIALAARYQSTFILVGRSQFDGGREPDWARGGSDRAALMRAAMAALQADGQPPEPRRVQKMVRDVFSQREIRTTLDRVAAAGGRAVYVAADVTDGASLRESVAEATVAVGPVTGILHGAGVLADKLVEDKALDDFERVISVKVDGLRNLLACVSLDHLAYLVLFSSVAGFYGNVGQADYAIANEVLNKVAHWMHRRAPRCRVLAMDWGPWDGGMVTPALREQLAARNISVIPVDAGQALLTGLVGGASLTTAGGSTSSDAVQIVVGDPIRPGHSAAARSDDRRVWRIRRRLTLEGNPFLRDHVIGGRAVLPTVCAVGWMVNACEQVMPGTRYARIDDYRALKGIVFDEDPHSPDEGVDYTLEIRPQAAGSDGDESRIIADVLILSDGGGRLPRYHYRATITLVRDMGPVVDETAPRLDVHALDLRAAPLLQGSDLYRDRVLFHGPSLQGVEAILSMDARGLLMRCCLPPLTWRQQGQFPVQTFNPYVVDVQLQSLLVWAGHRWGYGGLPLRIGWGKHFRPLRFGAVTYTQMTVRTAANHSLVADVAVFDEAGRLCMEVGEAEITLSQRLNAMFAQNQLDDADAAIGTEPVRSTGPVQITGAQGTRESMGDAL